MKERQKKKDGKKFRVLSHSKGKKRKNNRRSNMWGIKENTFKDTHKESEGKPVEKGWGKGRRDEKKRKIVVYIMTVKVGRKRREGKENPPTRWEKKYEE